MITFLAEKNAVANVLGKIDGATANTIRDNAINEVRQFDIANAFPFSWLERTTTLTTSSLGVVDLPADFNVTHKPKDVRETGTDTPFEMVNKELYARYGAGDDVYYIDFNTSTNRWRINTTEISTGLTIVYYTIPTSLTADADIDSIPDLTVIKYLAASRYWLTERNYGNFDRFNDLGNQRLQFLINKDKKSVPTRPTRINSADMGWNTPD
jgi:hypothetical protein